MNQQTATKFL